LAAPHVIVVAKRTAYRRFTQEDQDARVTRLLKINDPTVRRMRASHEAHEGTMREVASALEKVGAKATWVRRAHAPFDAREADLVVTVGGDGTLLAASHQVDDVPILGINSAPSSSVGFFCGAKKGHVLDSIERGLAGRLRKVVLARMLVSINEKVIASRVLNEALFCHASPAATSCYILHIGDEEEEQKSSGFWIGPAAGSTAAQHSAGGRILPLTSQRLQLVVREPYTPAGDHLRMTRVLIGEGEELLVRSKMRQGKLFLDGPHDETDFRMGDTLVFRRSPQPLTVLGLSSPRRWGKAAQEEDGPG
jgi:NAD+ kinase